MGMRWERAATWREQRCKEYSSAGYRGLCTERHSARHELLARLSKFDQPLSFISAIYIDTSSQDINILLHPSRPTATSIINIRPLLISILHLAIVYLSLTIAVSFPKCSYWIILASASLPGILQMKEIGQGTSLFIYRLILSFPTFRTRARCEQCTSLILFMSDTRTNSPCQDDRFESE